MKIVLLNDEGKSIASFDHVFRYADGRPAQAFELLDLLEKLLERAARDSRRGNGNALPAGGTT